MTPLEEDLVDRLETHPLKTDEQGLLLAAMLGDAELEQAISGTSPARPERASEPKVAGDETAESAPAGAYLRSITVSGFRGIGPQTTLELTPGPGLTVVCGRNGSGKSSFAEAFEVLLTGQIRRLDDRTAVWKSTWRCLHGGDSQVSAELLLEGTRGAARLIRAWKPEEKSFTDGSVTVRVPGEPDAGLERLGWGSALSLYRPFLSHAELEVLLDRPSQLYDQVNDLLGLEEIKDITTRLAGARKQAEAIVDVGKTQLAELGVQLAVCDDERARRTEELLKEKKVDLDAIGVLAAGGPLVESEPLEALVRLRSLNAPGPTAIEEVVLRLSAAAERLDGVGSSAAGDAAATADLLSAAVAHFSKHGPGDCPVCGRPDALDDAWLAGTIAQIERLHQQAGQLRDAASQAESAAHETRLLIGAVPDQLREAGTAGIDAEDVVYAWRDWAAVPSVGLDPSGLRTLAAHLTRTHPPLQSAVTDLQEAATVELERRQDVWAPLAAALSAWVSAEKAGHEAKATSNRIRRVETWMKAANNDLRNARLRPFADRTAELWSQLRQESNVDLIKMALTGSANSRAVNFDVTVDGNSASGLGVMSQGEINALALSVFLPRAASPDSPLRFVVIDDPVQAMDPSKVDGMARVLTEVAADRQVVVFTHDDRLPTALRNLQLPARIIQVSRQSESVVTFRPSRDPVSDDLDDAMRLAKGEEIPPRVTARVVPGLCRSAIEEACFEIARQRRLGRGDSHASVEETLAATTTLMHRLALAIFDTADRAGEVYSWLNQRIGRWAGDLVKEVNRGAHDSVADPVGLIRESRDLVTRLRERLP